MSHSLYKPTVFLIDDDDAVRRSLRLLITTYGMHVQSLSSAEDFLDCWHPDCVGCLVLDIHMSGVSGLTLQELLIQRGISTPIIFITEHGDVSACRLAFQSGAIDFLTKPVDEKTLIQSIQHGIKRDLKRHSRKTEIANIRAQLASLSGREHEVLELMLQGMPNKLIARNISLSTRTIESHRARIFSKLHAESLAELIRRVIQLENESTAKSID